MAEASLEEEASGPGGGAGAAPEGDHAEPGLPALPADVLHRIFGQLDW